MSKRRLCEGLDTPHLENVKPANIIFQASKYTYNLHYFASAICIENHYENNRANSQKPILSSPSG